jgi:hypothetical protein
MDSSEFDELFMDNGGVKGDVAVEDGGEAQLSQVVRSTSSH